MRRRSQTAIARPAAITLVELLVTIAIIAILAGLLLPSLFRTKRTSATVVCRSNQRQIGLAFQQYVSDNRDFYPIHHSWASYGGAWGNGELGGGVTPPNARPLNKYISAGKVFKCPSDLGDQTQTVTKAGQKLTCFEAFGNSYIVPHGYDKLRVKHVTGVTTFSDPQPENKPITGSEVSQNASAKIIQGDWPWFSQPGERGVWHGALGNIVLFGDGHVDSFSLEFSQESDQELPPDPKWKWW